MESETVEKSDVTPAATKAEARARAKQIVDKWTVGTAATGWLPGAGFFSGVTDQIMIQQIAQCFGVAVDIEAIKGHIAALIGSGIGGAASEALFFIPILGWAIKGAALAAKSRYIGEQVIRYFNSQSQLPE